MEIRKRFESRMKQGRFGGGLNINEKIQFLKYGIENESYGQRKTDNLTLEFDLSTKVGINNSG